MAKTAGVGEANWLGALCELRAPIVEPTGVVSAADAEAGLGELARLRGEFDALQARLVGVLADSAGRDVAAALGRGMGLTPGESRRAIKVAAVVASLEGASDALASGRVRDGHLLALESVAEGDRPELLACAVASGESVDDFAKRVLAHRIALAGDTWRKRQREARSVRFFNADRGCVGMRAVLPSVEGALLRARLEQLMDDTYRAEHPERAPVAGGHAVDSIEQRLADALVALVDGSAQSGDVGASSVVSGAVEPMPTNERATRRATRRRGGRRSARSSARAAVVVIVDPEKLTAEIVGQGPIPFDDAVELAGDRARADVYGAVRDMSGAVLKFGRSRRLASPLQHLALAVREQRCSAPGCQAPPQRCKAHHEPPFAEGGLTNVDQMTLRCSAHHRYRHETGETTSRHFAKPGTGPVLDRGGNGARAPARRAA